MNPKVDWFFEKEEKWKNEVAEMRKIALDCHLTEDLKWGCPCYTYEKKNIVLIHVFKEYCAFLFFKGALMKDPKKMLIQQTENVQSARQIRFTDLKEIKALASDLKQYIFQAVEVEESGVKVELKKTKEYPVPEELTAKFKKDPVLEKAFGELTPGRQRAYILHFSQPKQAATRESRIEKSIPSILEGKGLNEKERSS
ncbi:MAG: YdeI/OmpD-associated family protein [Fluviicola sp.]